MALVLRTRKPRCGYAPCASCGTFGYWYWREPEDEVAAQQRVGSVLVCSEECGMAWEAAQALLREPLIAGIRIHAGNTVKEHDLFYEFGSFRGWEDR